MSNLVIEQQLDDFLELLNKLKDNHYTSGYARYILKQFEDPDFDSDFWIKFNTNFKKFVDLATKYTQLQNEDPTLQLEVKRLLSAIRVADPFDLVEELKTRYEEEHGDELAKKKLRSFIKEYLNVLPKWLYYEEEESNDYSIRFLIKSLDQKKTLKFEVSIDLKNQITVFGSATYKDHDFEFEIEEVKFDPLRFPTLERCANDLLSKIDLRVSMKVSGTRIRIASYICVLSNKDLALAKADLLKTGETEIYALTGEKLVLSIKPEGRLLDDMTTALFTPNPGERLYFHVIDQEQQKKALREAQKPEESQAENSEEKKPAAHHPQKSK